MSIILSGTAGVTFPDSVLQPNGVPAPGTTGNVCTSNGTAWTSVALAAPASLSTASGSAPSYSARAWVNFNGTGTPAIRASGNVTSITDNTTGDYTVNFTTAMPDANYSFGGLCEASGPTGNGNVMSSFGVAPTTTTLRIRTVNPGVGFYDPTYVSVQIFR